MLSTHPSSAECTSIPRILSNGVGEFGELKCTHLERAPMLGKYTGCFLNNVNVWLKYKDGAAQKLNLQVLQLFINQAKASSESAFK